MRKAFSRLQRLRARCSRRRLRREHASPRASSGVPPESYECIDGLAFGITSTFSIRLAKTLVNVPVTSEMTPSLSANGSSLM